MVELSFRNDLASDEITYPEFLIKIQVGHQVSRHSHVMVDLFVLRPQMKRVPSIHLR